VTSPSGLLSVAFPDTTISYRVSGRAAASGRTWRQRLTGWSRSAPSRQPRRPRRLNGQMSQTKKKLAAAVRRPAPRGQVPEKRPCAHSSGGSATPCPEPLDTKRLRSGRVGGVSPHRTQPSDHGIRRQSRHNFQEFSNGGDTCSPFRNWPAVFTENMTPARGQPRVLYVKLDLEFIQEDQGILHEYIFTSPI
jgi:hypothetical protein